MLPSSTIGPDRHDCRAPDWHLDTARGPAGILSAGGRGPHLLGAGREELEREEGAPLLHGRRHLVHHLHPDASLSPTPQLVPDAARRRPARRPRARA